MNHLTTLRLPYFLQYALYYGAHVMRYTCVVLPGMPLCNKFALMAWAPLAFNTSNHMLAMSPCVCLSYSKV